MEKIEVYKKLLAAKQHINMSDMKKEGYNEYSNYNYFTPDQINKLVFLACQAANILTTFDLKRNEFGEYGELTIIDLDSGQSIITHMATAIPSITATNAAQQLGGCVTYTERYLKMSAFGISDNSLDPDGKDQKKQPKKPKDDGKKWLNKGTKEWLNAIEKLTAKTITMKQVLEVYKMKSELKKELESIK